jgi:hypothetical protein
MSPNEPLTDQINDAARRIEEEVKRVVQYIDAKVVPEVRRNSSTALRSAADQLAKLAEHLDKSGRGPGAPS